MEFETLQGNTPGNTEGRDWESFGASRSRAKRRYRPNHTQRAAGVLATAGLIAMGTLAVVFGVSWVRSQGAVNVVKAQVQAIHDGKIEQAYALFSNGYQAEMTLPMFRRWLRRQERLTNVRSLEFWGRSVWGTTAILWGHFEDDLGHSFAVRYVLVQENGDWRIDRLQLSAELPNPPRERQRFVHI